ncbi:hypothetical protein [Gracilimonas sediminicola]|uniref:Uncharacterized protein n=1 Tax=Gracilimonas sediminicola TaxID=2952158 RepID=A0A9X2L0B4_9BACT|nr:hypothetical protein [Gracilimonas sediminicola]MCP9289988.1 hypothetical protein [Gracilimonas sediminicola]
MKSGDYVKLLEPKWAKTSGQGKPPKGMSVSVDGERTVFEWGKTYKLSGSTNYPGNPDSNTYPLMHTDFAEEIKEQLELQQTTTED